jgi:hypothetical protein
MLSKCQFDPTSYPAVRRFASTIARPSGNKWSRATPGSTTMRQAARYQAQRIYGTHCSLIWETWPSRTVIQNIGPGPVRGNQFESFARDTGTAWLLPVS